MKKVFLLASICILMSSVALNAQVTIGKDQAPNPDAVLELTTTANNKGFLPPRVALTRPHDPAPLSAHVEGMVVYNTFAAVDSLVTGLYVNNGTQWVLLRQAPYLMSNWFYMPSFPINTSEANTFTYDLWQEYQNQFSGGSIVKNPAAPAKPQPKVYAANELNYYVTGYDDTVFSNVTVSNAGVLSYEISSTALTNVSDSTFMNIVLVEK
jgi:hypothetical protein